MRSEHSNNRKKWYQKKKFWIIFLITIFIISGINSIGSKSNKNSSHESTNIAQNKVTKTASKKKTDSNNKQSSKTSASKKEEVPKKPSVPTEYLSALNKAESYSNFQHLSKKGLFHQLTSDYGEKFSQPAAQYAIDNLKADWNNNALEKAKSYQKNLSMSPEGIRDQLISEYGEQFTPEEANYAINHLK
ncbi:Ltp family lipoprotein [Companilactobacillus heilongjiangensis]|uniref:Putative host cell surface-exposed lipoprotein Ltp-like HTH region domain-containing protein n=1 Tax=Companilactobacillus heilongjiangensis TaxID=1074467 RepID=A0A0K2LCK8_9LACO|nr:Ltp family lipoprotein [Companilactobacillus heilongjiangensis]ALB29037.1 hypothetical protein JP39_06495 [Companilactobacillus heilongjiangensis]